MILFLLHFIFEIAEGFLDIIQFPVAMKGYLQFVLCNYDILFGYLFSFSYFIEVGITYLFGVLTTFLENHELISPRVDVSLPDSFFDPPLEITDPEKDKSELNSRPYLTKENFDDARLIVVGVCVVSVTIKVVAFLIAEYSGF